MNTRDISLRLRMSGGRAAPYRRAHAAGVAAGVILLCIGLQAPVLAQSDRGTITGTVTDPAGAVIPNAAISARNRETGSEFQTVTTGTGNYTLPSLPAGHYDLTVTAPGFNRFVQEGIEVQIVQTARIDVVMKIGSASESVTVNADAPLLKTESAEQSHVMTGNTINDLPLTLTNNGIRNPISFAQLAPGTYAPPGGNFTLRVNGAPINTYKTLLDGQDVTSGIDPTHLSETQPSVEALQEVTLQSSNFAAEFGQVAGGLVNLTSRSGTNQFHGTGYEYWTNEALNAGQAYTNDGSGHLIRPRARNNNYGVTVGGPLWLPKIYNGRNRTFFFFAFDQFRNARTASGTFTTIPTNAYRNGDFSGALTGKTLGNDALGRAIPENGIYDPGTERTVGGQLIRDMFPGNIIPQSRFDPVAVKIQALMPAPSNGLPVNNLEQRDALSNVTSVPSLKLDQLIGTKTKISFYWNEWKNNVPKSGADGLPFPLSPGRIFLTATHTLRLNLDETVTPTFLVHLGIGELRYDHTDSAPPSVLNYDAPGRLGLVGSSQNPAGFPRLVGLLSASQGGVTSTLGPVNANDYYNDKPTLVGSVTLVGGNHTYKAGGEWRKDIWSDVNTRGAQGVYNFSAAETGLPYLNQITFNGGQVGFPYASFLLGLADSASVSNLQDPQLRKIAYGFFVQDTWKVTPKLTIDYGVRWDLETGWHELHYRTGAFSPSAINPSAGGLRGGTWYEGYGAGRCNCSFTNTYPFALGPRFGIAYQINQRTVFRGGWGIVYGRTADSSYITNTPIVGTGFNTLNFTSPVFGDPGAILRTGLHYNMADLFTASLDPGIRPQPGQINPPPYYIDPGGGRPPRINQWNISLQREITNNLVLEAAYVGNRGVWLQADQMVNVNALTAQRLAQSGFDVTNQNDRTLLLSAWNSPAAQARGITAPYAGYPTGLTVAQLLRPFPQFSTITTRWTALGNSWYDALQMKLTKRYSHGLSAFGAFSWQKELNLGIDAVNDIYNRKLDKYISQYSQPLVLSFGFTYKTPGFSGNKFVNAIVRDWTAGGFFRYASGLPIQAPQAQNGLSSLLFRTTSTATGATATFANRVPGQPLFLKDLNCHCIDPNKDFVLNPGAWSDPAAGTFGTAAAYYSDYRYQRRPSEQLGIGREFRIRESITFQIRGEFFNVFNRAEMANPVSNNALLSPTTKNGLPTGGFGYISTGSLFSSPRQGQLLARFQF